MSIVCLWTPAWRTAAAPPTARPEAARSGRGGPGGRGGRGGRGDPGARGDRGRPEEGEPGFPPDLAATLLEVVPRVALDARGVVWADGRGLPMPRTAAALLERARRLSSARGADGAESGADGRGADRAVGGAGGADSPLGHTDGPSGDLPRAGVAEVPIVAELAARSAPANGDDGRAGTAAVRLVSGSDRAFLAPLPLALLDPEPAAAHLLEGVGIATCGELAVLSREAVEVRFGAEGLRLWRLACAEDPRRLFAPIPPERPHASLDFIDYVVTDPARLVFTANALLGGLCDGLRERGEHAGALELALSLANGERWTRKLRAARPTASRDVWLRRIRGLLERLTVPDAVAGMHLEIRTTEAAAVRQGDLFDRGFATAPAVEAAVARLLEDQGPVAVRPETSRHPLVERRTTWIERAALELAEGGLPVEASRGPALTLQLLPEPRPLQVEAAPRRDHALPLRYRERDGWRRITAAAGPDRLSGGEWEDAFAREYFRCVSEEGALLWLYRDGRDGGWFLHGWWD